MKFTRAILSLAVCGGVMVAVLGASSCNNTPAPTVDITIFHTNDIHSHLRAEPLNSEKNPYNLGGLARLKTLVNQLRAQKPNSILLDAGDWSEATTYFNVDGGSNMLELMSAIGYNAAVVGNHDFLNGPSILGNVIEAASPSFPVLGANQDLTALASTEQTRLAKDIVPYTILTVAGVRVAVIGLLCEDFFYYSYYQPGVITNPVTVATQIANTLHNQKLADVIVLLSHNAFASNVAWAQSVPWVNVVISGHSHFKTPQPVQTTNGGNPAYIAETKQWGQFLGDMTLTVTPSTGQVVLKNYTLHPVSSTIAEDPTVAAMVTAQDAALTAKYGTNIVTNTAAEADDELAHDDNREVPLSNMAADAYRAAAGADIGIESVQLTGDGVQPGPLSTMQLMNISPHIYHPVAGQTFPANGSNWTIKKLSLPGSSLRGLLNFTFLTSSIIGWMAESGAQITWNASGGASAVQTINILNPVTNVYEPLNDSKTYVLALHDGLLMALGIIVNQLGVSIDLSQVQDTGIQAWQAVTNYVATKGTLHAADYMPGTRYMNTGTDLAFFNSDVQVTQTGATSATINVTIHNIGLTASTAAEFTMHVLASAPNDVNTDYAYNSPDETNTTGPDAQVPAIAPGASATVQIPWNAMPGPGIYALSLQLLGAADGNPVNATLIHHAHVGVP